MEQHAVWIPHGTTWSAANALDSSDAGAAADGTVLCVLEDDDSCGIGSDVVKHAPEEATLPRNASDASEADDLSQLVHLNEPCILHALKLRHARDAIYTSCGTILVAVNPWRPLPELTSASTLRAHIDGEEGLAPHPFTIARAAFAGMRSGRRQSVLVSGESGAGKTETTKILLQYLAASSGGGDRSAADNGGGVQRLLLEANPILESFGNAKTLRNHNSSRFGKWVDVKFDASGAICGGRVRTYLLEKSRVVAVPPGERSFHAFYQLIARPEGSLAAAAAGLVLPAAASCAYLTGGASATARSARVLTVPEVDDCAQGGALEAALATIGLCDAAELAPIARTLAASLLLGNVPFVATSDGGAAVDEESGSGKAALQQVAEALKVKADALCRALTHKKTTFGGEQVVTANTAEQACVTRDSLAKALFGGMFSKLVDHINVQLTRGEAATACHSEVGVLDIFGFETFGENGFEQLLINFANERLQGQFNTVVFEEQQREYESEGVPWCAGGHVSNARTLELLEGKLGVVPLLHEQCRLPRGDDANFAKAVRATHAAHPSFEAPRLQDACFSVKHYAGPVTYTSTGFVHKNRDAMPDCLLAFVATAECDFVRSLLDRSSPASGASSSSSGGSTSGGATSLAMQFKSQLASLLGTIALGQSHYIRCVTPNPEKRPHVYDPETMLHQLRCSGLMDAVRVAREGHPSRLRHLDFVQRFRCLAPSASTARASDADADATGDAAAALIGALQSSTTFSSSFAAGGVSRVSLGATKVFMQLAPFHALEAGRAAAISAACRRVQRVVRGISDRRRYLQTLFAAAMVVRVARGSLARRQCRELRRERACIQLQTAARGLLARMRLTSIARATCASTVLAAAWRCFHQRQSFMRMRASAVHLQCSARAKVARAARAARRREASDVRSLQAENARLREALQQAGPTTNVLAQPPRCSQPEPLPASGPQAESASLRQAFDEQCALLTRLQSELHAKDALLRDTRQAAAAVTAPKMATAAPADDGNGKENVRSLQPVRPEASSPGAPSSPLSEVHSPTRAQTTRAMRAEAEAARLRDLLRRCEADSKRALDSANTELAACRARLASRPGPSLRSHAASDPTRQQLELDLVKARAERQDSERKLVRQERVTSKLMAELREEKMRAATRTNVQAALERLRLDLSSKIGIVAARMHTMHESISRDLTTAAERLASSAATDTRRTKEAATELEKAATAARLSERVAQESRDQSETQVALLVRRLATQERMVASLLEQRASGSGSRIEDAEAEAAVLLDAAHKAQSTDAAHAAQSTALTPSPSSRLPAAVGVFAEGVMRVAGAARSYATGSPPAKAGEASLDRPRARDQYIALLEMHLGDALAELSSRRGLTTSLEAEDASAGALSFDEMDALAAAEAAADALFASDAAGGATGDDTDAAADDHSHAPPLPTLPELKHQAAAAALLEDLKEESLKSARLEKIISKLMGELRKAKLLAASADSGDAALSAFRTITQRLESSLQDNASAVSSLSGTVRKGLEAAAERMAQ